MRERPSWTSWGLAGVITGLTILTDPITIPFLGFCLAYAAYLDRSAIQKRLTGLTIAGAVVVAMLTPWLIRNYIVFNEFPVMKTGALGHVFLWGLKFSGNGSWLSDEQIVALEKAGRNLNELQEEEAIQREILAQFPSHWRDFVTSDVPRNVFNLWWDIRAYQNDYSFRYMAGRRVPFILLLCFAVPRVVVTVKRLLQQSRSTLRDQPIEVAGLALMVNYTVVYGIFGAFHSRYRLPIELVLIVLAAATLASLVATRRLSRNRSIATV